MSDLEFLHAHLPDFPEYADEHARNGSDMRVRAFVGMALTDAQERLAPSLEAPSREAFDRLIFKSQFSDNRYLKRLGHLHLADADLEALAREDRKLVDIATGLADATGATIDGVLDALTAQYEARHLPLVG